MSHETAVEIPQHLSADQIANLVGGFVVGIYGGDPEQDYKAILNFDSQQEWGKNFSILDQHGEEKAFMTMTLHREGNAYGVQGTVYMTEPLRSFLYTVLNDGKNVVLSITPDPD